LLEARNIFTRTSQTQDPGEWKSFERDHRFYHDPLNWDLLKRDVFALIFRYSHKAPLGTFDLALLAAARLAGATRMLSFDERLKALSYAEGLDVFPPLNVEGKGILAQLRS